MNAEQFLTCVRAYFPGAKVKRVNGKVGGEQKIEFEHPTKCFPHRFRLHNYPDSDGALLWPGNLRYPVSIVPETGKISLLGKGNPSLSEETLLKTLKRLNNRGWCAWQDIDE